MSAPAPPALIDARGARTAEDLALLCADALSSSPPRLLAGLPAALVPALRLFGPGAPALAPAGAPKTSEAPAASDALPPLDALLIDGPAPPCSTPALLAAWWAPAPPLLRLVGLCRLRAARGQPALALERLRAAPHPETPGVPAALRAWAEGDLCHQRADRAGAAHAWEEAAAQLRGARALPLLARLCRRRADRLATAGQAAAASRLYREAGALYRQLDLPEGRAAALRGLGDLAVSGAEALRADELYAQAAALRPPAAEQANLGLGRAGLALARGELGAAASGIRSGGPAPDPAHLRRAADLALREGQHERAQALAAAAGRAWAAAEPAAAACCLRLRGDAEAARGDRAAAQARYLEAAEAHARAGDVLGLRRTLLHGLRLAADGGPGLLGPAAWRALADQLDEADDGPPVHG
ncbi:MAG: hypothetical protein JNM72_14885 [Deltaproteobacteria bacterium]|nr:hypothetical protein [Deltaproteobacteria bacterium]